MEPTQTPSDYKYQQLQIELERPFRWRKYIFLFLTNWYWFLIMVFISFSIAYLKNRYTLPMYKATASLIIEDEESSEDLLTEIRSVRRRRNNTDMANEIAKLNTFKLHRRTIDSLGWDIVWTAHGRVAMERPIYRYPPYYIEVDTSSETWYYNKSFNIQPLIKRDVRLTNNNGIDTILKINIWNEIAGWKFRIIQNPSRTGYNSYDFTIFDGNTLAKIYLSKLTYDAKEDEGTVISISSQGTVADREIDYINMFCKNYIQARLEQKQLISENTLKFINEQMQIIQDSLKQTKRQLLSYRINKSVVDLSEESKQAYTKLQNYYNQKSQLNLKKNYYEYLHKYIQSKKDPEAIVAPILIDANDQLLINQVEFLQGLYEKREMLSFSVKQENPSIAMMDSRIQTVRMKIQEIIEGLIQNNELAWNQLDLEEKSIEKQLLQLPISEQELLTIQRKFDVNNQFYTFLLQKQAEAGIRKASTISNVHILNSAMPLTTINTGSKESLIYLIAILLGIMIPASIIFLVDNFDNRIKDRDDIEYNTTVPILGVVSHEKSSKQIPVYTNPGAAFAESFRQIRTNLQFILKDAEQKVIMISSTISGEGKTFIALNLSTIIAMNNKKVLLCGFDLRRPSIHKYFNINNEEGISTFLAGNTKYEDIIHNTDMKGLYVMNAGPVPPNPAELLETEKMNTLIEIVKKSFDYIIIDTPPIALVTDSMLISKHSHANILVIRQNYSPKGTLDIINSLKDRQLKSMSILVNDIRESKAFGYRYYYGYGYNYGYQIKYNYNYYQDNT